MRANGEFHLDPVFVRANLFTLSIDEPGREPDPAGWAQQIGDREGVAFLQGHQHSFDHLTVVMRGRALVYKRQPGFSEWSDPVRLMAPPRDWPAPWWSHPGSHLLIEKNVFHTIVSLEPFTETACFYVNRDERGQPISNAKWFPGWLKNFQ